jgi:hypothetical protein
MLLRSPWNVAKQLKDAKVKQQMAQAIASYLARNGAVTRCPPARARGSTEPSEQLGRPNGQAIATFDWSVRHAAISRADLDRSDGSLRGSPPGGGAAPRIAQPCKALSVLRVHVTRPDAAAPRPRCLGTPTSSSEENCAWARPLLHDHGGVASAQRIPRNQSQSV